MKAESRANGSHTAGSVIGNLVTGKTDIEENVRKPARLLAERTSDLAGPGYAENIRGTVNGPVQIVEITPLI